MSSKYWICTGLAAAVLAVPLTAQQKTDAIVRDFKLNDVDGRVVQLSDFKGKPVILEWTNAECPFVKKHYDSGNMQKTQAMARQQGAVWLTINSGAPGKQGYVTGPEAKTLVAAKKAAPTAYLLDPRGVVGKGFAAKTTPHMYVIDGTGKLVYQGGIDDKPTANVGDIASARNHVLAALGELKAGKPVSVKEARPYGCTVKYIDEV